MYIDFEFQFEWEIAQFGSTKNLIDCDGMDDVTPTQNAFHELDIAEILDFKWLALWFQGSSLHYTGLFDYRPR